MTSLAVEVEPTNCMGPQLIRGDSEMSMSSTSSAESVDLEQLCSFLDDAFTLQDAALVNQNLLTSGNEVLHRFWIKLHRERQPFPLLLIG